MAAFAVGEQLATASFIIHYLGWQAAGRFGPLVRNGRQADLATGHGHG
jgi:hypothetical protein